MVVSEIKRFQTPNIKHIGWLLLLTLASSVFGAVEAQQDKPYRIGVLLHGGHYFKAIEGLKEGLIELGFEEGKQYVLDVRAGEGELKIIEEAAEQFKREKVDLVFSLAGSVSKAAKRSLGDTNIPVVFCAGSDPKLLGLVASHARPGGNFTGIHFQLTNLTPKRLEILKEMVPSVHRALTFYNPANKGSRKAIALARDVAVQLNIELVEHHVSSPEEIRLALEALQPGEVDAYFFTSNAMVGSLAGEIIDRATALKLPAVFHEPSLIDRGALATYGLSFESVGKRAAKYVHSILNGARPENLPVDSVSDVQFTINLRVATALGLTISPETLYRATKVIQ